MKDNKSNSSVIIINKNNINKIQNNTADNNENTKNPTQKELINIGMQTKVFAILIIIFSVFLFISLVTYTSKDEPNLKISVTELFNLFSNNPEIRMKLDTTINSVGLVGAIISNLLINEFIGIWIIGLPFVLFIWGVRAFKDGEVKDIVVKYSYIYIIIAFIISCLFGSLSCFERFLDMPLYLYGVVGSLFGTIISNIVSPIGSSILFLGLLILVFIKLLEIRLLIKEIADKINKINIKSFFTKLNKFSNNESQEDIEEHNIIIENYVENNIDESDIEEINNTDEQDKIKSNIFNENLTETTDIFLSNIINTDNTLIDDFPINNLNKISSQQIADNINDDNISNASTMIGNAIFTFNPPENIDLPEQTIIPTKHSNNDKDKKDFENTEYVNPQKYEDTNANININNSTGSETNEIADNNNTNDDQDIILTTKNKPIKIELNKTKKNEEYEAQHTSKDENKKSFKNPLSVGVHDEKINYQAPKFDILEPLTNEYFADDEELQRNGRILQEKLETFKINISNLEVTRGPVVTQYEFIPADGVKINKIEGLADDLAMALKAKSVHIIAPVPEKGTVGIQIPNSNPSIVGFRSVIATQEFAHSKYELPLALGKTVSGDPFVADLTKMPHLLIAGSTGSGKSVGVNTIIASLLYKKHPSQLKFIIIDPKKVELTPYVRLSNHFLAISPDLNTEIVTEPQDAISVLKSAVLEMEKRYTLLEIAKQRNIKDYNEKVRSGAFKNDITIDHRELPYIVVIVDELADLMLTAGKEIELPIVRLAQMARAIGIHLIIATQRPSVNIITGIIKANFPSRIAYLVASKVDSRTILDASGAEALLGNGDMLFSAANQIKAIRVQNPFISTDEVERLCDFIGNQIGYTEPYILPSTFESANEKASCDVSNFDPLFRQAAELIITQQMASTSMLQRQLKIGFARAGRLTDELANAKVIGPPQGSKPRTVLMDDLAQLERVFI